MEEENNSFDIKIIQTPTKKRKIDESNSHDAYILSQNEELLNQNKKLIIELKSLQTEKANLEEEVDKMDRDKLHMRNFIKTALQSKHIQRSIIDNYQFVYKNREYVVNIFFILFVTYCFCLFYNVHQYWLNLCMFPCFIIHPTLYDYERKRFLIKIEKYDRELSNLEKSNNFLDDYIDNM